MKTAKVYCELFNAASEVETRKRGLELSNKLLNGDCLKFPGVALTRQASKLCCLVEKQAPIDIPWNLLWFSSRSAALAVSTIVVETVSIVHSISRGNEMKKMCRNDICNREMIT